MKSFLGTFALTFGVLFAASACYWWVAAARGAGHPSSTWRLARLCTWGMLAAALAACAVLEVALLTHDFSVRYVAENGGRAVPAYYTAISLWAALEGSLLLWLLVLGGYAAAVMLRSHRDAPELQPWVLAALSGVAAFFFGLARFAGNAFERVTPVPADGPGPNPLLQDHPLMGVHPPLLYLGYVGLTVPFAYALAALATGRTGQVWVALVRRWTLATWAFLTAAIVMGAWWSYEVLGWGGYWAWDPVENASIFPWFTATALLHSMMVQRRRETLRVWNLALAVATFVLMLIGTFITRSGVLASVHSFTESGVGPILLGFILAVLLGSAALFAWRADRLGPDPGVGARLSRETVFLGNNLLLAGLAFTVVLGTVFPLLLEAVTGQQVSVGAPYFNRMTIPLALTVLFLMGVGPLVPWGRADPRAVGRRLAVPAMAGLGTIGLLGLTGLGNALALLTFGLGAFVLTAIAVRLVGVVAVPLRRAGGMRAALAALGRRHRLLGGLTAHAGIVLATVAIAASSAYSTSTRAQLGVGESLSARGYTATLEGVQRERTPRFMAVSADVAVSRDGEQTGAYRPALRHYPGAEQTVGSPAVGSTPLRDVYVTVERVDPAAERAVIGLQVRPLVMWLWVSAGVMAAGALITAVPRRRRSGTEPAVEPGSDRERAGAVS